MTNQPEHLDLSGRSDSSDNCPFIGIKGEAGSFFGYASPSNFCFKVKNPGRIKTSHQIEFCLTPDYQGCEVFKNSRTGNSPGRYTKRTGKQCIVAGKYLGPVWNCCCPRPGHHPGIPLSDFSKAAVRAGRYRKPGYTGRIDSNRGYRGCCTFTFINFHTDKRDGGLRFRHIQRRHTLSQPDPIHHPHSYFFTNHHLHFHTRNNSRTGFRNAVWSKYSYLIHVVTEGENYPKIAQNYDTSVEVLQASNILPQGVGLRAGLIIVVLPGTKILPAFQDLLLCWLINP